MISDNIKQVKYNKINCSGCGESMRADLVAFDMGKVFAEVIREEEEKVEIIWRSLARLDLKFYYTVRDLCQELGFRMDMAVPGELTLTVKAVKRQIEFLMDDIPFSNIQNETRNSVLYNSLYEAVRSDYGSPKEVMAEIETLIRNLMICREDKVIMAVPIRIILDKNADGNEMAARLQYFIKDNKRELPARVCPQCGTPLDWLAGYRNEYIIGLAGLPRVGKTVFVAALFHQLKKLEKEGFISLKRNASESLSKFETEIVAEYEKGNMIYKTQVENTDSIPLVYIPLKIGDRECNFIFVDMPGEIYCGSDSEGLDFISNKRAVLKNADVVWCFIEPPMIDENYHNANIELKKEDASKQLSGLIRILSVVYNEKIPAGIIVTQSDLIDPQYSLFKPDIDVMNEYLLEDHSLDLTRMNDFVDKTRSFVDQMQNFRLSVEDVFEGISMFAVASYGFDVSEQVLLSDKKIQPSMVELPFLWTLAKLNLIKTTKTSTTKSLLGKEKTKFEEVENLNELYIRD